ncbi:MAG: helix-turn-helix domain-containing protein, partial [Streptosporangiales bacterium]|nr:helix-turn-helix domain-containing protein [Streptosporangiales bacterium]
MSESLANRLSSAPPPAAGRAFWALLAEPERAALRAAGRTRSYAASAPLCHEGAPARQVFILMDGWIKETSATEDGHELILELRGPGEVVGAPAAFVRYHRATATAVEEVRVLVLEVRRFLDLLDGRPPAARALMQVMAGLLHAADRRHALSQSGGAQRLALRLLELADRYGSAADDGSVQIMLPLAQHEIAGWAGISRETAARALRSWRRTNIVETARKQIRITDPEALRNTVGGGWQEPAIARPPSLEAVTAVAAPAAPARIVPAAPHPAQLPQDIPDFTGRAEDLSTLHDVLRSGLRTIVIQGMAGVGKTALAVRWAHTIAAEFPDGQLFLDLRGHAQRPAVTTVEALGQLLRALDVPAEQVPPAADEQAALYRSRLADRRVLIVLDDATGSDQVRPLLPGNPHSLVVVTSRGQLSGLVARDGARALDLNVLSEQEAIELVATVLGPADPRVQAEPEQAAELTRRCAYLPLAVRIAAANLSVHQQEPIEAVVNELGEHDRLSALALDEEPHGAVRTAFELSYRDLDDATREALRLLALMPGLDFTLEAMAALLGLDTDRARGLLRGLARAHLVDVPTQSRYRLHDLVRDFAFERLAAEDDVADCNAAERRLLRHYLRQAQESSLFINEHRRTMRGAKPRPEGARDRSVREPHMAWFESERLNLVAVAHRAKDLGPPQIVWELADAVYDFLELRRYSTTNMSIHLLALDAAREAGQPLPTAVMHHHLAVALTGLGRYTEAMDNDAEARRIF